MFGVVPVLLPILLADVINPVLLAAVIYTLGTRKPVLMSSMVLLGWLVVYFVSGVLLAYGLEAIISFLENPRPVDFYIEVVVSLLLFYYAIRQFFTSKTEEKKDFGNSNSLSLAAAFGLGATINLVGLAFAIPYFAAIDQILKADLSELSSAGALLIYNVLYILPFALLIAVKIAFGQKSDLFLQNVNNWMDRIAKVLLPGMMTILGIVLLIDAIMFFTTGQPWF